MPAVDAPQRTRTFDEAFAELNLTAEERLSLVWHLAEVRARRLVETLGPVPKAEPWILDIVSR